MLLKTLSFLFGAALAFLLAFGNSNGHPAAAIQLDYGQFMYAGLFASITILANTETGLTIEGDGVKVSHSHGDHYSAQSTRLGKVGITVSGPGLAPQRHEFEVRPLPDPDTRLGGNPRNKGGTMSSGEFRAQGGVAAIAVGICGYCEMMGYTVKYKAKGENTEKTVQNIGGRYKPEAQALIDQARPGDKYSFEKIRAKCPGDTAARHLPSIYYTIK